MIDIEPHEWQVNFGLGNGLMPSNKKTLPALILIQIYVATWRY